MTSLPLSQGIKQLQARALAGGGFGIQPGKDFRPDATAWGIMALRALEADGEVVEAARHRLVAAQLEDGRVSISPDHPESFWPTSLSVLAWQGAAAFQKPQERAVAFLLATSGMSIKKEPESVIAHNTELKGWSWRSDTVSWAEPTAVAMLALEVAGRGDNPRLAEAQTLLLDRQIPGGGWNYGNTMVFGQVLHPMPESTGMVLNALCGRVSRAEVEPSLAYLKSQVAGLKTPWSLGWALLGLGAWGERPAAADDMIAACLGRQERIGSYDTSSLALLLTASRGTSGLVNLWQP
jgi:hypothetical protein